MAHIDIASKITEMLANELAKEIDREILRGLGIKSRAQKIKELLNDSK